MGKWSSFWQSILSNMSMLLGWVNRRDTKIRALKAHRHIDIEA